MQAKVFYVKMTDAMYHEINAKGWDCETGRKYWDAKNGAIEKNKDMFECVFVASDAKTAEQIYMMLQNGVGETPDGFKNRSMDVGDLVVWEDGRIERCDNCGWMCIDNVVM